MTLIFLLFSKQGLGTDHQKSDGEGGGSGEKTKKKKIIQGKMPRKKIHAKKKVKKKKYAEGRSNCDFYLIII